MTPQEAKTLIEVLASVTLGLIAGIALLDYLTWPRDFISLDLREQGGNTHTPAVIDRAA